MLHQQFAPEVVLREAGVLALTLFVPLVGAVFVGHRVIGEAADGLECQLKKLKVTTKIKY